jgi:hypothetical protein
VICRLRGVGVGRWAVGPGEYNGKVASRWAARGGPRGRKGGSLGEGRTKMKQAYLSDYTTWLRTIWATGDSNPKMRAGGGYNSQDASGSVGRTRAQARWSTAAQCGVVRWQDGTKEWTRRAGGWHLEWRRPTANVTSEVVRSVSGCSLCAGSDTSGKVAAARLESGVSKSQVAGDPDLDANRIG